MGPSSRQLLIAAGVQFLIRVRAVEGVERIALIGSIVTEKPNPKDIDFVLSVRPDANFRQIATLGRKLKGGLNSHALGADIFLATPENGYLGRTCSHRECRYRAACDGLDCSPNSWINTDLHIIKIANALLADPPLVVWPKVHAKIELPRDIGQLVANLENL